MYFGERVRFRYVEFEVHSALVPGIFYFYVSASTQLQLYINFRWPYKHRGGDLEVSERQQLLVKWGQGRKAGWGDYGGLQRCFGSICLGAFAHRSVSSSLETWMTLQGVFMIFQRAISGVALLKILFCL